MIFGHRVGVNQDNNKNIIKQRSSIDATTIHQARRLAFHSQSSLLVDWFMPPCLPGNRSVSGWNNQEWQRTLQVAVIPSY